MKVVPPISISVSDVEYTNVQTPTGSTPWVSGTFHVKNQEVYLSSNNCIYKCIKDITANVSTVSPIANSVGNNPYWINLGPKEWAAGTYSAGQQVVRATTGKLYTCITGTGPVASTPPENLLTGTVIYWVETGASNKMNMFELSRSVKTVSTVDDGSSIVVKLNMYSRANTLALTGLKNATRYKFEVFSDNSETTLLYSSGFVRVPTRRTTRWYEYFFNPLTNAPNVILSDFLTPSSNYFVVLTIEGAFVECAAIVLGMSYDIGPIQRGASNDATNYSKIDRDVFANATLVPRRSVPKTSQVILLEASKLNTIRQLRDSLNAKVALWIGLDDLPEQPYFDTLLILGIYKQFSISLDNPAYPEVTLELEEI